jgi:cytochrome c oxidase cbb3-type subunit I/II
VADLREQAKQVAAGVEEGGIRGVQPEQEIVALIAYLQRLGTDIKKTAPSTSMK